MRSQTKLPAVRLVLPEVVGLDAEQYDRAQALSQSGMDENRRWQTYLDALACLGLAQWLGDRTIDCQPEVTELGCYLNVGDFKLRLIATEHMLDEVVTVPQEWMLPTNLVADFYVLIEVLEEQAQVILRGILRHDQLVKYCCRFNSIVSSQGDYQLPLDVFDPEINHLLAYLQFLPAIAIPSPSESTPVMPTPVMSDPVMSTPVMSTPAVPTLEAIKPLPQSFQSARTLLGQWLQEIVDDGWLTLDRLIDPATQLALNLRNPGLEVKRGRLIDLGMQVGAETVALLVTITPESSTQLTVLIQVHPTGGNPYLPTDLKLLLRSKAGKLLQEVTARPQDNYIQLKPFKGEIGKRFSVEISLGGQQITENFEF